MGFRFNFPTFVSSNQKELMIMMRTYNPAAHGSIRYR